MSASGTGRMFAAVILQYQLSSTLHAMLQGLHVLKRKCTCFSAVCDPYLSCVGTKQAVFLLE